MLHRMSMDLLAPVNLKPGEPRVCPGARPGRRATGRGLLWAGGMVSIALHLLVVGPVLIKLRPGRQMAAPPTMGAVELLMVEQQGVGPPRPQVQPGASAEPPPPNEAPPTPRVTKAQPAPSGEPVPSEPDG